MGGGLQCRYVVPDDGRMRPKHVELKYINKTTLLHQVRI